MLVGDDPLQVQESVNEQVDSDMRLCCGDGAGIG